MDPAKRVPLGRTDLSVSRLGLGLASLGGMFAPVPQADAIATIDRAWDLGVRLFDTAPAEITENAALLSHEIPPAFWAELRRRALLPA